MVEGSKVEGSEIVVTLITIVFDHFVKIRKNIEICKFFDANCLELKKSLVTGSSKRDSKAVMIFRIFKSAFRMKADWSPNFFC